MAPHWATKYAAADKTSVFYKNVKPPKSSLGSLNEVRKQKKKRKTAAAKRALEKKKHLLTGVKRGQSTKSNRPKPSAAKPANKGRTGMAKKANYATNANYKQNKNNFHDFMAFWGKK